MRIIVRADSSKTMGFGHITRSLTLARALQDAGADVIAIGQGMTEGAAISPSFGGLHVIERPASQQLSEVGQLLDLHPDGVVTDGYHFSKSFFEQLEEASIPYAVTDDNGETKALNPLVVHNQNPRASPELYGSLVREPIFLFGLDYALLRPEASALVRRPAKKTGRIVVSLGGTDSANLTIPIAKALVQAGQSVAVNERFKEKLLVMSNNTSEPQKIEFFPSSMFLESLVSADLAVLGAGTSLWEANALGISTIGVIVAENQRTPALTGYSDGYVDRVVNSLVAPSMESAISEIVAAASDLLQASTQQASQRVSTDGAELVARVLLSEFSKHSSDAR